LISNIVEVPFEKDASCELWDKFLVRVTDGNDELCGYLRRLVGYLLAGITTEQVLHFLFGLGANGKTIFCEIVQAILGEYAIVVAPDLIMARRHSGIPNDVARLRGVRAAFMNETSQGSRFDEAKLKDLTGSDTLTARFLHAEFFDFRPTHRIVMRGNHKPAINGTDEGIWRRLRLVPFSVQIPEDEQDRDLLSKLTAELPGILQWAIAGCLEWQRIGLKPPAIITDAVRAYREESDVLGRFIEERCSVSTLAQVRSSAFFSAYHDYCERAGERWMSSKELPLDMERRGFKHTRKAAARLYLGLELKHEEAGTDWRG
jgi:putative DNA primase/helicase